ncbi:MAG: xanthine dehydrogenase family protein molybdopterin-binding subunit, partial [Dehalococcoidia bacterium]
GRAQYGADLRLPGMLYGAVLRSPHAHARIIKLDTSKAEKARGVLAVMTGADMPVAQDRVLDLGEEVTNVKYASGKIIAHDKALFKGHAIAAVAAVDLNTALEALNLIDVEYEVLKPAVTIEEAMAPNAPIIHPDLIGDHLGEKAPNTNVAKILRHQFGDLDEGFAQASTVVEREYEISRAHQGYIEAQNATAIWHADDRISIWTSTQGAHSARESIARVLMHPESSIRVTPMEIGGGFGGKIGIYLEPLAAILSRKSGRPVKMVMERKSVFEATGPAPGGKVRIKLGVDTKGVITAATADIWYGAGAYPGASIGPASSCVFAPYRIPNLRVDGYDVVINLSKTAAYRAPGAPQVAYAMESTVDEVCREIGMDPLEFRLLNGVKEGDRRADGPTYPRIGYLESVQAIKDSEHYKSQLERIGPDGKIRGRGVASGFWHGAGNSSTVTLNVNEDGVVSLVEGSTDIGGSRASIAMQAAEALGLPIKDVRPNVVDTDSIGYNDVTGGSRTTMATGEAAIQAALKVVEAMKKRVAMVWETEAANVEFADGVFSHKESPDKTLTFQQAAGRLEQTGGPVSETASVRKRGGGGGSFATHVVDVAVDPETGKVDILRYTAAQDAGKAVHPSYVEGQFQGGVVQGIGWALNEEYYLTPEGVMQNSSFLDYRMPTALDVPNIDTIIVEVPNAQQTYGVRGVGETPICPPAPAIANALRDALGIRLTQLPMKPGRVLDALVGKASVNGHSANGCH